MAAASAIDAIGGAAKYNVAVAEAMAASDANVANVIGKLFAAARTITVTAQNRKMAVPPQNRTYTL